ncbi:hypothetical protein E2C01_083311 [Portunus trituberculatus]|uniref:Uncharacterized protein n=1 Tax=Portunus trituberculatus TaxID=210409 RepID=A0A5B7J685_PORTR|nr:hypothetical protein [Portunus trituberculatus]
MLAVKLESLHKLSHEWWKSIPVNAGNTSAKSSVRENKLKTVAGNARGHALPKRQPEARAVKDIVDSGAQSEQCVKKRASGTPESTQRGTTPADNGSLAQLNTTQR